MNLEEILKSGSYHLIDVRQPMELDLEGAVEGAINIPLATVPLKINEIKEMQGPKIIFYRSGGRSGAKISCQQPLQPLASLLNQVWHPVNCRLPRRSEYSRKKTIRSISKWLI